MQFILANFQNITNSLGIYHCPALFGQTAVEVKYHMCNKIFLLLNIIQQITVNTK